MEVDSVSVANWSLRSTARSTLVVVAVVFAFGVAVLVRGTLLCFFAGVVLATALKPVAQRLRRLGISYPISVLLVYFGFAGALTAVAALIVPLVVEQAAELVDALPGSYEHIREQLNDASNRLVRRMASTLPENLEEAAPSNLDDRSAAAAEALNYGRVVIQILLFGLVVLVLSFSWSLHEDRTIRSCLLLVPTKRREAARELIERMQATIGAYVLGQGLLCLVIAIVDFLAFKLIGLPYALPLALLAGLLEAVPFFGPILGAVPALLIALSVSPWKALLVLVAAVVIQNFEGYVLAPRVMSRAVGVHGFVMLLAIAAFGALMGVAGAILAVPLAAIVQLLLNQFLFHRESAEPPATSSRDSVSRMRYQLRELVQDVQTQIRHKQQAATGQNDRLEAAIESIAQDLDDELARLVASAPSEAAWPEAPA